VNLKGKIVWGKLAALFIGIHFTFVIIYALPDAFSSPQLKTYASAYVEPVFTQKWAMFAPCPTLNGYTEVRYVFEEGDTSGWIRPTDQAKKIHDWTKGLHYGELVLAESNLIYWLSLDLDYLNLKDESKVPAEKMNAFFQGYSYFKIKDYTFGNANYIFNKVPTSAEIRFYLEDVVTRREHCVTLPIYQF